jgi:hypothetical protein
MMRSRRVGIEGSAELTGLAQSAYPNSTFIVHVLTRPLPNGLGQSATVVAHVVLMDIPEIDTTFAPLAEVLRPGACFAFTILHPSFRKPDVPEIEWSAGKTAAGRYAMDSTYAAGTVATARR